MMVETELELEQYLNLIRKESWSVARKLWSINNVIYEFDDLVNEGILKFYDLLNKYNKDKARFSTILTICLRNHFINIIKSEARRTMENIDTINNIEYNFNSMFVNIEKLDAFTLEVLHCILEIDEKYVRWLERRYWAKKHLKLRYRDKPVKDLLEEYYGKDLSKEFAELKQLVI